MYQVFRFWDGWSRWSTYSNIFSQKSTHDFVFFFKCLIPCNLKFPYFPCFFTQKQGDDWSTLGAKLEGLMFNHQWYWHESPQAPWQTFAMQILEDLFPFSKVFLLNLRIFFEDLWKYEKTNTSHKSLFESLDWKPKKIKIFNFKVQSESLGVQKFVNWSRWFKSIPFLVQESGSPVEVGSLSYYLHNFIYTSQVVVWDFFHQQYWKESLNIYIIATRWQQNWSLLGLFLSSFSSHRTLSAVCVGQWRFVCRLKLPFSASDKDCQWKSVRDPIWKIPWKILPQYPIPNMIFFWQNPQQVSARFTVFPGDGGVHGPCLQPLMLHLGAAW